MKSVSRALELTHSSISIGPVTSTSRASGSLR